MAVSVKDATAIGLPFASNCNTLLGKLADTVFDTEGPYASANFDEERYQMLSDIVSRRRNFAKKQLIKLTPRLATAFPNVLE